MKLHLTRAIATMNTAESNNVGACSRTIIDEKPFLYPFDAEDYAAVEVTPSYPKRAELARILASIVARGRARALEKRPRLASLYG